MASSHASIVSAPSPERVARRRSSVALEEAENVFRLRDQCAFRRYSGQRLRERSASPEAAVHDDGPARDFLTKVESGLFPVVTEKQVSTEGT
jgi:hypothetical protein